MYAKLNSFTSHQIILHYIINTSNKIAVVVVVVVVEAVVEVVVAVICINIKSNTKGNSI